MADDYHQEHRPRQAPAGGSSVPPIPVAAPAPVQNQTQPGGPISTPISDAFDENFVVGSKVGDKYEILEIVGRGSMGIVYRARHELIGKIVAVKMLRWQLLADVRSKKRFEREAIASSRLEHPNIIAIYDFGLTPTNQPYIVMDFVQGKTLLNVLRKEKYITPERAVYIFAQVADALHHAHTRGVIHRDLKPANVMLLEKNGQEDYVKVVDLGIAKIAFGEDAEPEQLTKTNEVCGSPLYLSPEQCKQQPMDPRSDMYSLGVVMYELLMGIPPLQGATVYDTLYMHVHKKPLPFAEVRPDANIPKRLEEIIFRTLEKNPGDRFATMLDLRKELESVYGYRNVGDRPLPLHVIAPESMLSPEMVAKLKLAEGDATPYLPHEAIKAGVVSAAQAEAIAGVPTIPVAGLSTRRQTRAEAMPAIGPSSGGPDTKTIIIAVVSAVVATALTVGILQFIKPGQTPQPAASPIKMDQLPAAAKPTPGTLTSDSPFTDKRTTTNPKSDQAATDQAASDSPVSSDKPSSSDKPVPPLSGDAPSETSAKPAPAKNIDTIDAREPLPSPADDSSNSGDVQFPTVPQPAPQRVVRQAAPKPAPPTRPKKQPAPANDGSADNFFGIFDKGK